MHVTPRTFADLVAGRLSPEEARALSDHLDGECELCERVLATSGSADGLDGAADAAIAMACPPSGGVGNDLEFAAIMRSAREGAPARAWRAQAAAAAAMVLVVATAGILVQGEHRTAEARPVVVEWNGMKGRDARPLPVRLRFLVLGADGSIEKGIAGEPLDPGASLMFEVEASRPADVAVARVGAGGEVELLWRRRVNAGRTDVTLDGRPAAYPLSALGGRHRFVLLASDRPLPQPRASEAAAVLAPPGGLSAEAPELDGLSIDVVELTVR